MKSDELSVLDGQNHGANPIHIAVWGLYKEIFKDGYLFVNRDAGLDSDLFKRWVDLYECGLVYGYVFCTFDKVQDWSRIDAIILCDRPADGNPLVEIAMQSKAVKYFIAAESPIIYSVNWDREYHRQFLRVWTWDDSLVDGAFYLKCNSATDHSLACDFLQQKEAFSERKLVTMFADAKASQHPNELYSHRVRAIRWFEASAPGRFDLYGIGWDKGSFPSYRGAIEDKLPVLAKYRFCICYEDAQGYPGYITEKMLDCFRVGVVPVYGGAPNVERWIPSECFISINQFKTYYEMFDYLNGMSAETHGAYLDRIEEFVSGEKYYPFSIRCMIEGFTRTLSWDLRQEKSVDAILIQDPATLKMQIKAVDVPLVVLMTYDAGKVVHRKLRGLWQFFSEHFPAVHFYFVRLTDEIKAGEVLDNQNDILVGSGTHNDAAIYDLLLRRHQEHFIMLKTTIFDVFDPEALRLRCGNLDSSAQSRGPLGFLTGRGFLEDFRCESDTNISTYLYHKEMDMWFSNLRLNDIHSEECTVIIKQMLKILKMVGVKPDM